MERGILMDKVIFLDRDGTINEEVNYLFRPEEFRFILKTVEAIKIFRQLGYKVIVITNQAGVAKGYYKEEHIGILHKYIDDLLKEEDTNIDGYYYCPHHPEGTVDGYKKGCMCRKPNIGMIEKASKDFSIDLSESIIVGDKEIDVQTGKNAGIGTCILVKSGHKIDEENTVADGIYDNLYEFAMKLKENSTCHNS